MHMHAVVLINSTCDEGDGEQHMRDQRQLTRAAAQQLHDAMPHHQEVHRDVPASNNIININIDINININSRTLIETQTRGPLSKNGVFNGIMSVDIIMVIYDMGVCDIICATCVTYNSRWTTIASLNGSA
jgi:hypothetical protein